MTHVDYFDVLPYHPQPQPLESLTGYLLRLAEGNGLQSVQGLVMTCFPTLGGKKYIHIPTDHPLTDWRGLPTVAACAEDTLRATTFYHLAEKFGAPTRPQGTGAFLRGSIAYHFRYCPLCLAERGYHALPWRFVELTGCAEHTCRLLDRCGHCGNLLPILPTAPLRVGLCGHCGGDLRHCQSVMLTDTEQQHTLKQQQALEFLLSPKPAELEASQRLGRRLVYWRLKQRVTAATMAEQLGIPRPSITFIEQGRRRGAGGNFERYQQYVAYLGLSWPEVFTRPLPPDTDTQLHQAKLEVRRQVEQELVEKAQTAIKALRANGQAVNQKAVAQQLGYSVKILRGYRRIKEILDQITATTRQQHRQQADHREQVLFEWVEAALDRLIATNQPLSQKIIAKTVGAMLLEQWLRYPRLRALFAEQEIPWDYPEPPARRQREDQLVEAVQAAIIRLRAEQQAVTKAAIGRIVGLTPGGLRRYPRVRTILDQATQEPYRPSPQPLTPEREHMLRDKIQAAARQLAARHQPFSQEELIAQTGFDLHTIRKFPALRQLLTQIAQEQQQLRNLQAQQRAEDLLAQVQQAIATLQKSEPSLTQTMIAQAVGMSLTGLGKYPRIKVLMAQAAQKH